MKTRFALLTMMLIATMTVAVTTAPTADAQANPSALTMQQRRAYLEYYAPVLFKKADEGRSDDRAGRGWMSNFDFDNDKRFSNNKENWEDLDRFLAGERADWDISPTMYTAMIEYTIDGQKQATLIYHPYFAKQRGSIHDWERIEINLSDISGDPGTGEKVDYVVVTEHSKHNVRPAGHEDLNFMPTENGKHVMIWRADQTSNINITKPNRPYKGEHHFVEDSWSKVSRLSRRPNSSAKVDINGHDRKGFHYVFVPESDREAVKFWNAPKLDARTAESLASERGTSTTDVKNVRRIRYELQDLADIVPTFWAGGRAERHWDGKGINILIEDRIDGGLDGGPSVPAGLQRFEAKSIDSEDKDEDRKGYINKHWFWGSYLLGCKDSFTSAARKAGAPNGTRMVANGDPASKGRFNQHDYFQHSGQKAKCDSSGNRENGQWLPDGWHLPENGGFDGRWVPLFEG